MKRRPAEDVIVLTRRRDANLSLRIPADLKWRLRKDWIAWHRPNFGWSFSDYLLIALERGRLSPPWEGKYKAYPASQIRVGKHKKEEGE